VTINAVWILLATLLFFGFGYRAYGRFLAKVFGVDPERKTPAHTKQDGVDFVPARNWWVLFGHHFSSICGAGPIVGPVLAVAYWGWGASWVWILVGAVFFGAVSDFSSLMISVRGGGESIPELARPEVSPTARLLLSVFIWLSLILVIAVFSIFAAKTYIQVPEAVLPSWGLIPLAVGVGFLMYRTSMPTWAATLLGVAGLGALLIGGEFFPMSLPVWGGLKPEQLWIGLLLIYAFVASVAPVQTLLQPRDYLASFLLFGAIGGGVAGVLLTRPVMDPTWSYRLNPSEWEGVGAVWPIWPMLFITIACGAISGFHALVSSGTTCKQLSCESHACRIGYGGMLVEGLVAALVVICAAAALSRGELVSFLKSGGPITAFSEGYGRLAHPIFQSFGVGFAVMALNAFILTTLDTATRIGRYLTTELFGIRSSLLSTALVVAAAGGLAFSGAWGKIWPAFGASNQLVGALALLVVACWLVRRGRPAAAALIPAILMLITTLVALGLQLRTALETVDPMTGRVPVDGWILAGVCALLIGLAVKVALESWKVMRDGAQPASIA